MELNQKQLNKKGSIFATSLFIGYFVFIFSIPQASQAGILSKIGDFFTSDANAQSIDAPDQNSQTAPVLEGKVAPAGGSLDNSSNASLNLNSTDNILEPQIGAMGSAADVNDLPESDTISVYVTKKGDTLKKIADMYDVSVNTILWANDGITAKSDLKEGTTLLIMPVSGVYYTVHKGDTLAKIAKKYSADAGDIAKFNGITDETLVVGDSIVIPDGEIASAKTSTPSKSKASGSVYNGAIKILTGNGRGTSRLLSGYGGASQGDYYRQPVPNSCPITQWAHGKNGVDRGCNIGTSVHAAADGTVTFASGTGRNGGYGHLVIITHPNGTQTVYGHLSTVYVTTGQHVNDGQTIALTGNTGDSTGPHLHFEVRGAKNFMLDNSGRPY